jgi:hypothetical protein
VSPSPDSRGCGERDDLRGSRCPGGRDDGGWSDSAWRRAGTCPAQRIDPFDERDVGFLAGLDDSAVVIEGGRRGDQPLRCRPWALAAPRFLIRAAGGAGGKIGIVGSGVPFTGPSALPGRGSGAAVWGIEVIVGEVADVGAWQGLPPGEEAPRHRQVTSRRAGRAPRAVEGTRCAPRQRSWSTCTSFRLGPVHPGHPATSDPASRTATQPCKRIPATTVHATLRRIVRTATSTAIAATTIGHHSA